MNMKKIKFIIVFLFSLFLVGCSNDNKNKQMEDKKYQTKGFKEVVCNIDTETNDNSTVEIKYHVFYNHDGYIEVLKSNTTVNSKDENVLKQYYDAYKKIYKAYENLEYYDNLTEKKENQVVSNTYINYGKIDIDKLMEIEGEEDNVKITNGKVKLTDWKTFAKKFGATCEDME